MKLLVTLVLLLTCVSATADVAVCVGPDGALHLMRSDRCKASDREYQLAEASDGIDLPDQDKDERELRALSKKVDALANRVEGLELAVGAHQDAIDTSEREPVRTLGNTVQQLARKVAALEQHASVGRGASASASNTVKAPFIVLDASGRPIFQVGETKASGPSKPRVSVFRGSADNYLMEFARVDGTPSASIGETKDGPGLISVHDDKGAVRARMHGPTGFVLLNGNFGIVGSLAFSPGENGMLELMTNTGEKMVDAGTLEGVGVVRVGPYLRCIAVAGPTIAMATPDCLRGKVK